MDLLSLISSPKKEKFEDRIKETANYFLKLVEKKEKVLVISHFDTDGITSNAMFVKFLKSHNIITISKVLKQLDTEEIKKIKEKYSSFDPVYVFLDFGTSLSKIIKKELKDVIIIDHHQINKKNFIDGEWHLNPFIFNVNGDREITTGGLTYFLIKNFVEDNYYLKLAVISIFGDRQPFEGYNKKIIDEAFEKNIVIKRETWKVYGRYFLPIYRALARTMNIYIDNITGNELYVLDILSQLGIKVKDKNKERTLEELDKYEREKLLNELKERGVEIEDIYGEVYEFVDGKIKDINEISTLINSSSRLNKPSIAIAYLLGDKNAEKEIYDIYLQYRKELTNILKIIFKEKTKYLSKRKNVLIIHGKDLIKDTFISVIVTIIHNTLKEKITLGYAYDDNKVKISIRNNTNIDIPKILEKIFKQIDGEGGGHKEAAGAIIPKNKLNDFIELFLSYVNS